MMKTIRSLRKNTKGATAIEYGLLAALIAVAAMGGMSALGGGLDTQFKSLGTTITTPNAGTSPTAP